MLDWGRSMDLLTPTVKQLWKLAKSERRAALETIVAAEFKVTLLMSEGQELPLDQNYFDLGLTSLRVTEVKQRLEAQLGSEINASVLLEQPTVEQLMAHLTGEVLTELFAVAPVEVTHPPTVAVRKPLVDKLLKNLYEA